MSPTKQYSKKRTTKILDQATAHLHAGQLREADALCCDILQNHPEHADALHLYGLIADRIGRYRIAEEMISKAIRFKPTSPLFHNNLGIILLTLGKREEANHEFRSAVQLKSDYMDAVRNLADSLEKSNDLAESRVVIARGLEISPSDPFLMLTSAKLERREGNQATATSILQEALRRHSDLSKILAGEIHLVLGQILDRAGDTDSAFQHFVDGNRLVAEAGALRGYDKQTYSRMMDKFERSVTPGLAGAESSRVHSRKHSPVFLVGFPRSGTTLLDQILSSHPELLTIEEKPIVDALHETYCKLNNGRPPLLEGLGNKDIRTLQETYFSARKLYTPDESKPIIIDKLPLNTWRVPLIWRTFPEAKFILAIRHPCDVILSCFMQYFTVNDAMSHFFTLKDAAAFYAKVMGKWISYVGQLPIVYHQIRYEDLINDVEAEARKLLEFLGVKWDGDVLKHAEKASQRKAINTPSYHQVTQPIYRHAEYRWKRYEKHFEPVMGTLAPFIEYFGYSD